MRCRFERLKVPTSRGTASCRPCFRLTCKCGLRLLEEASPHGQSAQNEVMSTAVDIYVPAQWATTVPNVLAAAGFHVTARDRKLSDGSSGYEYSCTRDNAAITFTEMPIPRTPRISISLVFPARSILLPWSPQATPSHSMAHLTRTPTTNEAATPNLYAAANRLTLVVVASDRYLLFT